MDSAFRPFPPSGNEGGNAVEPWDYRCHAHGDLVVAQRNAGGKYGDIPEEHLTTFQGDQQAIVCALAVATASIRRTVPSAATFAAIAASVTNPLSITAPSQ